MQTTKYSITLFYLSVFLILLLLNQANPTKIADLLITEGNLLSMFLVILNFLY